MSDSSPSQAGNSSENPAGSALWPAHWPCAEFQQRSDLSFIRAPDFLELRSGIASNAWRTEPELWWNVVHESDVGLMKEHLEIVQGDQQPRRCRFRIRHAVTAEVTYLEEVRQRVPLPGGSGFSYKGGWLDCAMERAWEESNSKAIWSDNVSALTRNIAHDLNNAFAGILSLSEFFQSQMEPDHPMREGMTLLRTNAQQATASVTRLTRLHQSKRPEVAYHDLNELARQLAQLLQQALPRHTEVHQAIASEALPVYLDAEAFFRAVLNTTMGCMRAAGDVRSVTVSTAPAPLELDLHPLLAPPAPPLACLTVQVPLPQGEVTAYAFQHPLWPLLRYAQQHHAGLQNTTSPSRGAVTLLLPQADFAEADQARAADSERPRRILLVADSTARYRELQLALAAEKCQAITCLADPEPLLSNPAEQWDAVYNLRPVETQVWENWVKMGRARNPALMAVTSQVATAAVEQDRAFQARELTLPETSSIPEQAAAIAARIRRQPA